MKEPNLPASLSEAAITSLPDSAYYIPNFITQAEEEVILEKVLINSAPRPTWRHLSHRRLQAYPSTLTPQNTLLAAPLPTWLSDPVITRLLAIPVSNTPEKSHIFSDSPHQAPNHVLVNEYAPGQGIFPHEDGSAYHPVVATVSLGSHIVLDIYAKKPDESGEREEKHRWRILQEPRSLLITTGALYRDHLHGIAETDVDEDLNEKGVVNWDLVGGREDFEDGTKKRETRVSLTFRDVLKVKKLGKGLGFLGK
ncbi:hypothetical protein MMC30_001377 [Trapelia coarctata]|nr:hypothetical protein [Trapelia coarctata]